MEWVASYGSVHLCFSATLVTVHRLGKSAFTGFGNPAIFSK
ncbi:MAG: hypothetical protein ACMUJM_16185 [bacterium]